MQLLAAGRHFFFRACELATLTTLATLVVSLHGCGQRSAWSPPPPGTLPEHVVLTLGAEPCREMAVTWRTSTSVRRGAAEITVAVAEPDLAAVATAVAASTQRLDRSVSDWNQHLDADASEVHYHSAFFRSLEPGTTYAYRVGAASLEAWSEWHQFTTPPCPVDTTAPRDESASAERFRFLYFGDLQNGVLSHGARAVRGAFAKAPDAAFALYAGDLVNDGHWDLDWSRWHAAGGWLHATLPTVPVVGNHEVRPLDRARQGRAQLSIFWRPQFALPVEPELPEELAETAYRFDIGAARFFVLNTSFGQDEQGPWLVRQLEQARHDGVRWQIVSFHFPTFSNAADRDNPELRAFVRPLFAEYGVDLVLQGHDHSYSRGHDAASAAGNAEVMAEQPGAPVEGSTARPEVASATGPVYVVSVAGAKQYRQAELLWGEYGGEAAQSGDAGTPQLDRYAANTQLYQVIEVAEERLSYRAYSADGALYDGFELLVSSSQASSGREGDPRPGKRLVPLPDLPQPARTFANTGPYRNDHWR